MDRRRSPALVLRRFDFSETSQVLHLFSRSEGKVHLLAKGIKRKNRVFDGVPDLLDRGEALWLERSGRAGLGLLTEWRLAAAPASATARLRTCLPAYYTALYLAELTDGLLEEYDPHATLFDAMLMALSGLDGVLDEVLSAGAARDSVGARVRATAVGYALRLLDETGHLPVADRCVSCGGLACLGGETHFSSAAGGLLCRDCEIGYFEKRRLGVPAAEALAEACERVTGADLLPPAEPAATDGEVWEVLRRHFRHLLGREPATERFLS